VSDRLRKQVAVERQRLHRLLAVHRPLLEKCATTPPGGIELSALAAMLHSFYNGVENIFVRISEELDGPLPGSRFRHRELLDSLSRPAGARSAAISQDLVERLDAYLDFRHFFRHSYTFDLRWDRMKALVNGCDETLRQLEAELDDFLRGL
jgi:HepT-like protein